MATNTLTVTDVDTKQSVTVQAFTGGSANPDGTINPPGKPPLIAAPNGVYFITDNPNPTPKSADWYGLLPNDSRLDDYGGGRSGFRLHEGSVSEGCVTVNKYQTDADKKWQQLRTLINNTKTEQIDFIAGPHWWNETKKITKFGSLTIK